MFNLIISSDDPVAFEGGRGLDVDVRGGAGVVLAGAVSRVSDPSAILISFQIVIYLLTSIDYRYKRSALKS
jgi:hypothetical protein